jgi:hypothetical protein
VVDLLVFGPINDLYDATPIPSPPFTPHPCLEKVSRDLREGLGSKVVVVWKESFEMGWLSPEESLVIRDRQPVDEHEPGVSWHGGEFAVLG